jgi:hypothetical protein
MRTLYVLLASQSFLSIGKQALVSILGLAYIGSKVLILLGIVQATVLLPVLQHFGITDDKLGYFVLNNTSNNDTTLDELAKSIKFLPAERRLRCMGHILNLIAKQYLFGQDASSFEQDYQAAGNPRRRELWRQRGELRKLYNLVQHVIASGKRSDLFEAL